MFSSVAYSLGEVDRVVPVTSKISEAVPVPLGEHHPGRLIFLAMSSDSYRRQATSLQKDIADLQRQKSSAINDRARIQSRIADAHRSMSSNRNPSNIQSKVKDIERLTSDLSREENKVAGYETRIASKHNDLARAQESLSREEESEARQRAQAEKRREDDRKRQEESDARQRTQADKRREDERKKQDDERRRQEQRYREEQQRRERRMADERERQMSDVSNRLRTHDDLHAQTMQTLEKLQQLPEEIVTLFVAANPADQDQLRLDEEIRLIEQKIRLSEHRDSVKLVAKWAVRP